MTEATLEKLSQALSKIDRPGSFAVRGSVPAVLPGLQVEGLGTIGLPLTAKQASEVDRSDVLAGLARALLLTEQPELLSRVVAHALALPKKYPLREAHLPALEKLHPWLKGKIKKTPPALTQWVAACRGQLQSLTARAPVEPTDFRRSADIPCKCADCAELKRFLVDPSESVHRFRMRQDRRSHLESNIRTYKCDLSLKTDRSGSPQTLVCTKNTASYQETLKTYLQDQVRLSTIRVIESSLPPPG